MTNPERAGRWKMMMKELQAKSVEFAKGFVKKSGRRGSEDTPTIMIHMTEELGELASQVYNEIAGRGRTDMENVGEEIADIWFDLCLLADRYGIDIEKAITSKMEKDEKRLK